MSEPTDADRMNQLRVNAIRERDEARARIRALEGHRDDALSKNRSLAALIRELEEYIRALEALLPWADKCRAWISADEFIARKYDAARALLEKSNAAP